MRIGTKKILPFVMIVSTLVISFGSLGTTFDGGAQPPIGGSSAPYADFNGDRFADLAIGVPNEDIGSNSDAGAVNVLYGSFGGLTATGNQVWHQDSPDIEGVAEPGDQFGRSLVWGDFNDDGFSDLAVGVPFEDVGTNADAGAVNMLYGSSAGLTAMSNQVWHQDSSDIAGVAEPGDAFGFALAAGDFNNDNVDDLAVGVLREDIGSNADAGAVNVLYGSLGGLTAAGNQVWSQDSSGIEGVAEPGNAFGGELAVGDFNNDGVDDLAIGVPREDIGSLSSTGAVNVLYGSVDGLTATGNQVWDQDSPGIAGAAEQGDNFGAALAVGDFNNDSFDDLAIGVLGEAIGGLSSAGAVNVLYGSFGGLTAAGNQIWHQDQPGIQGVAEAGDNFGSALAVGDFNNDSFDDLAIGVRNEDIGSNANAGAVNVLYGSSGGLTATENQVWHQDSSDIAGVAEPGDAFGWALAVGAFNTGGFDDLAIGVLGEDIGSNADAGAVNVLYGSSGGLTAAGNQVWSQDSSGIEGVAEPGDMVGWALAAR